MSDSEIFFRWNENFLKYFAYKSIALIRYKWHNYKMKRERKRKKTHSTEKINISILFLSEPL